MIGKRPSMFLNNWPNAQSKWSSKSQISSLTRFFLKRHGYRIHLLIRLLRVKRRGRSWFRRLPACWWMLSRQIRRTSLQRLDLEHWFIYLEKLIWMTLRCLKKKRMNKHSGCWHWRVILRTLNCFIALGYIIICIKGTWRKARPA